MGNGLSPEEALSSDIANGVSSEKVWYDTGLTPYNIAILVRLNEGGIRGWTARYAPMKTGIRAFFKHDFEEANPAIASSFVSSGDAIDRLFSQTAYIRVGPETILVPKGNPGISGHFWKAYHESK